MTDQFVINNGVLVDHTISSETEVDVVIPHGVIAIRDEAFADCSSLQTVIIPGTVNKIATNAFEGCDNLTIYAPASSYAEQFAKEKGIPFVIT